MHKHHGLPSFGRVLNNGRISDPTYRTSGDHDGGCSQAKSCPGLTSRGSSKLVLLGLMRVAHVLVFSSITVDMVIRTKHKHRLLKHSVSFPDFRIPRTLHAQFAAFAVRGAGMNKPKLSYIQEKVRNIQGRSFSVEMRCSQTRFVEVP